MLLPLLLLLSLLHLTTTTPLPGLDSFLTHHSQSDPLSKTDSFKLIPPTLKNSLTQQKTHPPVYSSLQTLNLPIQLTIHLVGPTFSSSSPSILTNYLINSISSNQFNLITPFSSNPNHTLSISHSLQITTRLSQTSLSNKLISALSSRLSNTPTPIRSVLTPVSYSVVDDVILDDFKTSSGGSGVHIYVLNLNIESKKYAYRYGEGESGIGRSKCLGSVWVGKERYVWIDLGAGPVDYGPGLSGEGVMPRGEFHPLGSVHGRVKSQKALLADVAGLVWSAYQVLLVPSLRMPVLYEDKLVVEFVHVFAGDSGVWLDWKGVESTLRDELVVKGQSLEFRKYDVRLRECVICSYAVSRATVGYTSRYLFDNYTLIVSEYLDSKKLHQTILDSGDEFRRVTNMPEEDNAKVLPVYVFDLDASNVLLLDRYHQSVAFKDMVIAVRTKSTQTVSDYSCNGNHVFTQTRELERPLVGSILQSMWGVSPTHMVWSPRHNTTLVDYTWSVGQTPFGPFSEISSLSFVQKDAAKRNVILTSLNYSITSGIDVLESIASHGGDIKLLKHNRHSEFMQRWNLFRYKLEKTVSSLSHFDYDMAMYYLKSAEHDLYAMHTLVFDASQNLEASLVCFTDPPFPWASASLSVGIVFCLFYAYTKRDKFFDNKRKRF